MRILLTGHQGYIGTVMTPMLLKAGHEVVGYDSDLYRRCTYPAGGAIAQVPTIEKDTRDLAALEAPMDAVNNEAFNVGQTSHNYRIRDLAEIVASVVPGCAVEFAPDAGPDTRNYRVSCDKIRRVLPAFQPQWDARKGAEQLYAAYRSTALALDEFEGPRYQRIAHIKKLLAEGIVSSDLRVMGG